MQTIEEKNEKKAVYNTIEKELYDVIMIQQSSQSCTSNSDWKPSALKLQNGIYKPSNSFKAKKVYVKTAT